MGPVEITSIVLDEAKGSMDVAVTRTHWLKLLEEAAKMFASVAR